MESFPAVFRVRQKFERPEVADPTAELIAQLERAALGERIPPGGEVAVAVGSRGIAQIAQIVQTVVAHLKRLGAKPFLVPSMGSHGGGTATGQEQVLRSYGIMPSAVGCPIRSSMDTVVVCRTPEGIPVHFDRHAFEADAVVVINRIKPHTKFVGPIESGLMKMLLIGLGKAEGARVYHRAILDYSFDQIIRSVAAEVIARCGVVAGVAIVENAYHGIGRLEVVPAEQFADREPALLQLARKWMGQLPFEQVDLLLIDQIGKHISGTGLDTNVVGRKFNDHRAVGEERPKVKVIALRQLAPESHGNAIGMGIAEFCRSQLVDAADLQATRLNAIVSGHVSAALVPITYDTDREMLGAALQCIGLTPPQEARLLWIRNTLDLEHLECGAAYWEEAQQRDDLEVLAPPRELAFDDRGNLVEGPIGFPSGK